MVKFWPIIEALLLEKVITGGMVSRKSKTALALMAVAGLLAIVAAGFMIQGFHIWTQSRFTPEMAALVTGGAILAIAMVLVLTALNILHHRRIQARAAQGDLTRNIQAAISMLDEELGDKIRENPQTSVILASLAGYILADRIL